jgi:hypothetical protein
MTRIKIALQFIGVPCLGAFAIIKFAAGEWDSAVVALAAAALLAVA